ncbi:MAG: AI-2E family transporter [Patescibacteria group bacterium]
MQNKIIERCFFFGLLFITLFFSFLIFRPFWIVILLSVSFAIVLYPFYNWINKKGLPSWLSSFITVFLFTILLLGPLLGIGAIVFNQSQDVYNSFAKDGNISMLIDSVDDTINNMLPSGVTFDTKQKVSDFILFLSNNIAEIFSSTLSAFFSFFLMLLAIFYFLKDGIRWKKILIILSPLSDTDDRKIIDRLKKSVNGVMRGYLLISVIQGLLMSFGLWLFGVPNAALWGVVAAVASLIPMIGTAFVSVPAIIFLFITGNIASAFGLLVWSLAVVSSIDNLLNPIVISNKINIHPLFVLFSVLGGISLLGPVGVLIGPLTLSLLYTLISIYKNEFQVT